MFEMLSSLQSIIPKRFETITNDDQALEVGRALVTDGLVQKAGVFFIAVS